MKKYRIKPIQPRIAKLIKSIKLNPLKSLSLGIIILGMVFISFFAFGILSQPDSSGAKPNILYKSNEIEAANGPANDKEVATDQANEIEMAYDQANGGPDGMNPSEGDFLGTIEIPALQRKLDVFQGTGEEELSKGVGHFTQSVLPGIKDNCVLSGHNDSVFTKLDQLEMGDLIIVETAAGKFTYMVHGMRVVDKDDRTVIVPTEEAVLTLTTCYPFIVIGPAPERYIVTALMITIT